MSLLSDLEKRIERAVEGIFSRSPKQVEAMDLARFLRKEMGDGIRTGLNRSYAPNAFEIRLSPEDHEHLDSLGAAIPAELENYLKLEAQQSGWEFVGDVVVRFRSEGTLSQGEVDITAQIAEDAKWGHETRAAAPVIVTPPPRHSHRSAEDSGWQLVEANRSGAAHGLPQWGAMIGRSRYAEISVDSLEVSRQHAQITFDEGQIIIEDLESTNGTIVNGRKVKTAQLKENDEVTIGNLNFILKRKRS